MVWGLIYGSLSYADRPITIARVIDGDTFVTTSGEHIRLLGIDAPELQQQHGPKVKSVLEKVAKYPLTIVAERKGAYGRTDAVVEMTKGSERVNLAENLLYYGHAWVSPHYCPKRYLELYTKLEAKAKKAKRGLWVVDYPISPWDFRSSTPVVKMAPTFLPMLSIPSFSVQQCFGST